MNIRKTTTAAAIGLAICTLASSVQAVGINGAYNYTLVLRDQWGQAIGYEGGKVSDYYTFEVYNAAGQRINLNMTPADRNISNGCNCLLSVSTYSDVNNPASGYAVPGEQLTLVVKDKSSNSEVFRSSKILPPIQWSGANSAPIGVFYADPTDTDGFYDYWAEDIMNAYLDAYYGETIGGMGDDYDNDGLSNLREYQFGTDPTGDIFVEQGMVDTPNVSITEEQGGVIKVSFTYGFNHVYSVRAIEGTQTYGVDGQDLALYDSLADLNAGTSSGKYFYDGEWGSGPKTFYVNKPNIDGTYMIGLAVDGRLLEYITVGPTATTYDITWLDDTGAQIDTTEVTEGDTPTHEAPVKAAAAPYTYTFTGWTPAIEAAASNTTYTATFKKVVNMDTAVEDYTAQDGDEIVGTSATYTVTVPGGATVTINGVTVAGAAGGASVPDPEFAEGGESVTTKFSKKAGEGNVWTITAFAEMSNESRGTDVTASQVKVYRADTLEELKIAEAMADGVTITEKASAVKVTLEAEAPTDAEQQFFRVDFGE